MEDKNFNFAQTRDALSQLSADILELSSCVKKKQAQIYDDKQAFEKNIQTKDYQLACMDDALQNALSKIEQINQYIEESL